MTTTSHVGGPEGDTLRPVRRAVAGPLLAFVTCLAGLLGLVVGVMPAAPAGEGTAAMAGAMAGFDPSKVDPAMMQQIKGLHGCVSNAWPYTEGGRYLGGPAAP